MARPGTQSGAVEHRYGGRQRILLSKDSRDVAALLVQEAQIRRDFGEEGVTRFWKEIAKRAEPPVASEPEQNQEVE